MPKLIIGADIVPTYSNQEYFEKAQMEHIVESGLMHVLESADYRIFNLEVPLTDNEMPIKKCGSNLIASTKSVEGLKQMHIDFLTLANNHILDQDVQGLNSTVKQLNESGIAHAGTGSNLSEASHGFVTEVEGIRVGIYCCAEHEFSIATEKTPGANPFDPLYSLDHIAELRSRCDYLVCLYHGGKEHYRYPSPRLQQVLRRIVDKGADLVIAQHTHCIGCEEKYGSGTIVYGQGNFLFDDSDSEFWQTSLLVTVDVQSKEVTYLPIVKDGNGVKLADKRSGVSIMQAFYERSREAESSQLLHQKYAEFAKTTLPLYVLCADSMSHSLVFRIWNRIMKRRPLIDVAHRAKDRFGISLMNYLSCEAHRELFLEGLTEDE